MVIHGGEEAWPEPLRAIPAGDVVHVDVREDLRAGREPFGKIMVERQRLSPGGALCVRAIFEPVPLYGVLERQGFAHHTERLDDDDWRVWFYPTPRGDDAASAGSGEVGKGRRQRPTAPDAEDGSVRVLDVRGLEPPEPMVRTLEALESLPDGHTLIQINARVPRFLLPRLEERGFVYEIREESPGVVRIFVRRGGD